MTIAAVFQAVQYAYYAYSIYSAVRLSQQTIRREGPRLASQQVMTAEYGSTIPYVLGVDRTAGIVLWTRDLIEEAKTESSGGSKGGGPSVETTTYSYYWDAAVAVAVGPVGAIRKVWANGKLILDISDTATADSFYAGNRRGDIRLYLGGEDQLPAAHMEALLGVGNVPAYRGVAYIMFEHFALSDFGNAPPNITAEVMSVGSLAAQAAKLFSIPGSSYSTSEAYVDNGMIRVRGLPYQLPQAPGVEERTFTLAGALVSTQVKRRLYDGEQYSSKESVWCGDGEHWAVPYGTYTGAGSGVKFVGSAGVEIFAEVPAGSQIDGGGSFGDWLAWSDNNHPNEIYFTRKITVHRGDDEGVAFRIVSVKVSSYTGSSSRYHIADAGRYAVVSWAFPYGNPDWSFPVLLVDQSFQTINIGAAMVNVEQLVGVGDNVIYTQRVNSVSDPYWIYVRRLPSLTLLRKYSYGSKIQALHRGENIRVRNNIIPNRAGPIQLRDNVASPAATYVADALSQVLAAVGKTAGQIDVTALAATPFRGLAMVDSASARDVIEQLEQVYRFNLVKDGGVLRAVLRGGSAVMSIPAGELVEASDDAT